MSLIAGVSKESIPQMLALIELNSDNEIWNRQEAALLLLGKTTAHAFLIFYPSHISI